MPALPADSWIISPDVITAAIKLLAVTVGVVGGAFISVLVWIYLRLDSKVDRIATSLEALTLTTATDIAAIKATCVANHKE